MAIILGGSAIALQIQTMNGYTRMIAGERPYSELPGPVILPKETAEVCKTKEDCVDCKKRPEAPEWWNRNK
jgi:hypothetical protein